MGNLGPELSVDRQPAVEGVSWASSEAEGEFALEHEDGCARRIGHGEEFEDEGTGNLDTLC